MKNWFKRKLALLAFALSKTEKIALGQREDALVASGSGTRQTYNQGTLADALLRGEITLPVKELRWRLYKVLSESKSRTATITGYDKDDLPIVKTFSIEKYKLNKIIFDSEDPYPVELVVNNTPLTKSTFEAFDNFDSNYISGDTRPAPKQEMFEIIGQEMTGTSFTHVEIPFDDMMSEFKDVKTLFVVRESKPKFEIEFYAKKMLVRNISDTEKLLEFYVSEYPDEYNRKSRLFLSDVKKCIKNPRFSDLLEINKVGFISDKTIGCDDGLEYEYEITNFHKIVKFNGFYVIKFKAKPIINGEDVFSKYKLDELEERYENKEAKKPLV